MALRALRSVQMGWYLAELVLMDTGKFYAPDFEICHQGAKFIYWLLWKNDTQSTQIRPKGLLVGPEGYMLSSYNRYWNRAPGKQFYYVTEKQKWHLECPSVHQWHISPNGLIRVGLEGYRQISRTQFATRGLSLFNQKIDTIFTL